MDWGGEHRRNVYISIRLPPSKYAIQTEQRYDRGPQRHVRRQPGSADRRLVFGAARCARNEPTNSSAPARLAITFRGKKSNK